MKPYRYEALATYNAECARGVLHTPEWHAHMAEEQKLFNAEARQGLLDAGLTPHPTIPNMWVRS